MKSLGTVPDPLAARARFVSEALRPAETTDAWRAVAAGDTGLDIGAALADVSVIEAANESEEALALAVALRETLERSGSAVLVTPDRTLARRVREELARWGIVIDDSGGEPLATTQAGALAGLVLDCVIDELTPVNALALLAHPAVRLGRPRGDVERLGRLAELVLLRGVVAKHALRDPAALVQRARMRREAEHVPTALRRASPQDLDDLEGLLTDLVAALDALLQDKSGLPLGRWASMHEDAVAALVRSEVDGSALAGADAAQLEGLFEDVVACADPAITTDCGGYAAIFGQIVAETVVRGPARSHPRLKILGLLEMRLLSADRVLLGGLDETIWPPQGRTDAFLNRPMRATLGLSAPERRIGQTAHDFEMALGQREVIISRSAKRGGSPTVPSRLLQRMAAVAGPNWEGCRLRGRRYLELARTLDHPERTVVLRRPAPKPPVDLRPTQLSVTRIETLRRDPYAIYADRVLRLQPLDPLGAAVGPREWGTLFHGVLSAFVNEHRHDPLPPSALAALLQRTTTTFSDLLEEPHFRTFMAPRLERWARGFHEWEFGRRGALAAIHVEDKGVLDILLDDGSTFTLTAHADRLERTGTGTVHIVDYKTGATPSKKEVAVGFAPQLTLEAAIAQKGGFAALGAVSGVEGALYVKFGTGREPEVTALTWDGRSFDDVVAEHLAGLRDLLNSFRDSNTGYMARPFPQFVARYSDYDHLSRVAEWSTTGGSEGPES